MPKAREENFQRGNDRRISFVWDRATWNNLSQGDLHPTGNPLDVAIGGKGYFSVQTPAGERLTRNGAFQIDSQYRLVNNQGQPVLGESGPIVLEPTDTDITIAADGTISAPKGGLRGRLRISDVAGPKDLKKEGDNLFSLEQGAVSTARAVPLCPSGLCRTLQCPVRHPDLADDRSHPRLCLTRFHDGPPRPDAPRHACSDLGDTK